MDGLAFAASPNWYCSRVCDCNSDGLVAFGAKGDVFLMDISSRTPLYQGRLCSSGDRVVGLRFCQHVPNKNSLVTASESGKIKIWNAERRVMTLEFRQHKNKASCVDWSLANPNLIASGDEKGFICLYYLRQNWPPQTHFVNKAAIICLAFCPRDDSILAVGFRTGLILIVNVKQNCSTLHLLRRHDDDIQSLAWAPEQGCEFLGMKGSDSDAVSAQTEDNILASTGKDGTLRIWSMAEGKLLTTLKMVSPSAQRSRYQDETSKSRLWMTAYWPALWPNRIYCSGPHGEMMCCDFLKEGKQQWQAVTQQKGPVHQRPVYSIVGYKEYACSISMDRQIIIWNFVVPCSQMAVPTLGGYVYSLHFSPVDSGVLAVGVGDNMIRIWKTQLSADPYTVTTLWQGIRSKVTALSWHPTVEGRLAFGTEEGRIGLYNTLTNKPPAIFDTSHRGVVYTVTWGPNCSVDHTSVGESAQTDLSLYSCGQGRILVHNPRHVEEAAKDINDIVKKQNPQLVTKGKFSARSDVAWSSDYSLLAAGNEDGSIEIFLAPQLKRTVVIVEGRKLIHCLCWHPQFVTSSAEESDCKLWLAVASTDSVVHVYNLARHVSEAQEKGHEFIVTSNACKLEGHTTRVVGLCWSPHVDGRLVSVSYDGTAQVWCVITGTPVANYRGHVGRLYSTQWSPFDPDVVFTGGEDFTLQQWKVSAQTEKRPPETRHIRAKYKKSKGGKRDTHQEAVRDPDNDANSVTVLQELLDDELPSSRDVLPIDENLESPAASPVPNTSDIVSNQEVLVLDEAYNGALNVNTSEPNQNRTASVTRPAAKDSVSKKKKKRTYKSMLPQSGRLENRGRLYTLEDILLLTEHVAGQQKPTDKQGQLLNDQSNFSVGSSETSAVQNDDLIKLGGEETAHLGPFGNRLDAVNTLKTEATYHRDHDNVDYAIQTEIWRGNVSAGLKLAAEEECLSEWMVALAPLASRDLWKSMCQSYADQLVKEGSHHQAVLYLLAIHNVYGAIDVLKTHISYRDAMVLAKARLSPSDPVITELASEWAGQAVKDGNFELAAKCHLSLHNFQQASDALAVRTEPYSLKIAARLSDLGEDHNKAVSLAQQSLTLFLLADNWESAREVIEEHDELKMYNMVVSLHEILQTELGRLNSKATLWETHQPDVAASLQVWHPYHINGKPFLCAVLQAWISGGLVTMTKLDSAALALEKLQQNEHGWEQPRTIAQLTHRTSLALSKSLLTAVCESDVDAMDHIVDALALSFNSEFKQFFQALCRLLLPTGILDVGGILPVDENPELQLQEALSMSFDSIKAYYSMAVLQVLLDSEMIACDPVRMNEGNEQQIVHISKVILDQCLHGTAKPGDGSVHLEADAIPFIDKDEESVHSSESAENGSDVIQEIMKHLLVDCRARKFVLEVQLECIKKAMAQLAVKQKLHKTRKTKDCHTVSANGVPNQSSQGTEIVLESSVVKGLSTSPSENTEKTIDYVENLEEIVHQDTSESGMDSDIFSEISSISINFNLPCCIRYCQPNLNRKELEMETKRIENDMLSMHCHQMLEFPNPLDSAAMVIKYCKLKQWDSLSREAETWLNAYTTILVGKESGSLL